jgi:PAS domain S-box-containing protein
MGAAVCALAIGLQWVIHPLVGSHIPFIFFLVALLFSAVSLGRGPALLVLLGGILNGALLSPPVGSVAIQHPHDLAAVLIFAAVGLVLVTYGSRLRLDTARAAREAERLALAQQNTGVGIFELDFAGGTASVSPSLCQMLGRQVIEGEINLEAWLGEFSPEHLEESRRVMQAHIAAGELRYEREQKVALPNGETRWLLNRVELEATPAGTLRMARGAAVDITDRKRVNLLLERTQASLQQQLEDQGRLYAFSQKLVAAGDDLPAALQGLLDIMTELYGTPHGVVGLFNPGNRSFSCVAKAGLAAEALDRVASTLSTGSVARRRVSAVYPQIDDPEYESLLVAHRALSAQEGLREVHSMPLLSARGEVMGVISMMFAESRERSAREMRLADLCATTAAAVVERERARAAAASNEKRFSVALESSGVPFTILTPVRHADGRVADFVWSYVNPAAARALGRHGEELIGQSIGVVLPGAWDAPGLFDRYVKVAENGEPCEFEVPTSATNQGVRWYSVVASPLQGSVAVWFANITDRKLNEQTLRDADRRKDEFLATLAHELRNPLAPIRQGVRVAAANQSTDAQKRWSIGIIERQVQHMSLLLDDLLDASRIGRGTLLLRKSREPLSSIVNAAMETARPQIEAKRHQVTTLLPETQLILDIDPVRITQVLGNLLTNAAKYTDAGGQITLSAAREAGELIIRVRDNGIGLSEEQQTQVFEMFSQVSAAVERSQGGLGIGLALARGLIQLHGGTIEAASGGLGSGTEFSIRLPGSCVMAAGTGGLSDAVAAPVVDGGLNRRILIADDNADAADSLAELLRLEGHEVHVAYDGAQALAMFERVEPDAALLDVGMPNMSGLEVVRAIRRSLTGQRATLIAITGWAQDRDRQIALEAGFDHHLTKPTIPHEVQRLISGAPRRAMS